jgi:hypothetical protein
MTATWDEGGKRTSSAKAAVIAYAERLVRGGLARFSKVDGGVELTLSSGEVFLLGEAFVKRVV